MINRKFFEEFITLPKVLIEPDYPYPPFDGLTRMRI